MPFSLSSQSKFNETKVSVNQDEIISGSEKESVFLITLQRVKEWTSKGVMLKAVIVPKRESDYSPSSSGREKACRELSTIPGRWTTVTSASCSKRIALRVVPCRSRTHRRTSLRVPGCGNGVRERAVVEEVR